MFFLGFLVDQSRANVTQPSLAEELDSMRSGNEVSFASNFGRILVRHGLDVVACSVPVCPPQQAHARTWRVTMPYSLPRPFKGS